MAKRYFVNGKEITAEKARELDKQNQKLIASGRLEDLVKCKVICTADNESVRFGMSPAPSQSKPKKSAAKGASTAAKKPTGTTTAKKPAKKAPTKTSSANNSKTKKGSKK